MGECKTKAIQTNLGTFRHNQTYPGIIQVYLEPCLNLTFLKLWYIPNPNILRIRSIFRTPVYSELCYIQNPGIFRTLSHIYEEALIISRLELFSQIMIIFAKLAALK